MGADRSSTVFSPDDRRVSKDSTMCTGVKWAHCSLFLLTEQRDKNLELAPNLVYVKGPLAC